MAEDEPQAGAIPGQSPFRPAKRQPFLTRALPVTAELPRYRPPTAQRDVLAGVTVAALALPSAMAYAELAGLSPVNGLYALLLPTVAYLLLGSSRQLIVGPEGSVATMVAAAVLPLAVLGSDNAGATRSDARPARGRLLCDRPRCPARLGRRLLLAAGADRVHPRRCGGSPGRSAGQAVRCPDRGARADSAIGGARSRARRHQRDHGGGQRRRSGSSDAVSHLAAAAACGPRRRGRVDRSLLGARSRRPRCGDRRSRACRAAQLRRAERIVHRDRPAASGRGRDLSRLVRRRDPDCALVRRTTQPACPRVTGADRDGCRRHRRRPDAGFSGRRKWFAGPQSTTRWARARRSREVSPPRSSS